MNTVYGVVVNHREGRSIPHRFLDITDRNYYIEQVKGALPGATVELFEEELQFITTPEVVNGQAASGIPTIKTFKLETPRIQEVRTMAAKKKAVKKTAKKVAKKKKK